MRQHTGNREGNPALAGKEYTAMRATLPWQAGREPGPADHHNTKKPLVPRQKILFIGTLGSGKTTLAEYLVRDTGFSYASIDECRLRYADGTAEGEERAWDHFLVPCSSRAGTVLEFSGIGPHAMEVRDSLRESFVAVTVIWPVLPLEICIMRAQNRQKVIPFPYPLAPVDQAVPAIHDAVAVAWETLWTKEPRFHAERLEFSGTEPPARVYSRVRRACRIPG